MTMQLITHEQQSQWNGILVDILREFISICTKYHLTYYCASGTAIGAIRHHGIIPWDDDIDVFMPRPDYERFQQLAAQIDMGNYEVKTPYQTENYPMYFSKMCNKNTTILENEHIPCVFGMYIDIFPLDGTDDDVDKADFMMRQFQKVTNRLEAISNHNTFRDYLKLLQKRKEWGRFVIKTVGFFCRKALRRRLLKQMDAICKKYPYENATNVTIYSGSYGRREICPKEWVKGSTLSPFEGIEVSLASGYDQYLRQLFGDYMTLPPKEKRVSHHEKVYFNMERSVPFAEIMKTIHKQD